MCHSNLLFRNTTLFFSEFSESSACRWTDTGSRRCFTQQCVVGVWNVCVAAGLENTLIGRSVGRKFIVHIKTIHICDYGWHRITFRSRIWTLQSVLRSEDQTPKDKGSSFFRHRHIWVCVSDVYFRHFRFDFSFSIVTLLAGHNFEGSMNIGNGIHKGN